MIMKMLPMIISLLLATAACSHVHHAVETEMFAIPISPNLFNWTYQEFDQQYRFHASLQGKPELPSWLRYIYSGRHHSGFIFGTPPRGIPTPITLEVIGLNRQDYETRRVLLTLVVHQKQNMARHEVELKIDNLNVEDLLDEHKMTRLKDILRTKLWVESSEDLYATFLASAIDLGARLPLKPSDGEGLVIRLGSTKPFSAELKRLREEVRPLSRLPSCPRDYKRTTVERWFRDAGLTLDWCNFELYNTIYTERSTKQLEYLIELPNSKSSMSSKAIDSGGQWHAPARRSLPSRSYSAPLTVALLLPTVLLLSVAAITALVCCHYPAIRDPESENFLDNIFHICDEYRQRRAQRPANACRYGTDNTEQTHVADNVSAKSLGVSPNNSLVRPYSPKSTTNMSGDYNRPLPPPYLGSATTALHQRKANNPTTPSTTSHTPDHTRTHLEESLKLLNDAKICNEFEIPILNEPIMDIDHGNGDYVPANLDKTGYMPVNPDNTGYMSVKPDKIGYVAIKSDLDDIGVPDLAKFGIRGPM